MKPYLLFTLLISGAAPIFAQAETVIYLTTGSGYTSPEDSESRECAISDDRKLTYRHFIYNKKDPQGDMIIKHQKSLKITRKAFARVLDGIEKSRAVPKPYGRYETGYGDLPNYDLTAYPDTEEKEFDIRSEGEDIAGVSKDALKLTEYVAHLCGMSAEIKAYRMQDKEMADNMARSQAAESSAERLN